MPRESQHEKHTIPAMSWDIAAAIDGFTLDPHATTNFVRPSDAHVVALGKSRRHGPVAVKAHAKAGKAEGEKVRLERIAERGLPALTPLEVAAGQMATYLVMKREPGLSHLGQFNWARTIADPQTHKQLLPRLEAAAGDVADLHSAEIIHGDLQARNMMYVQGKYIAGDVEAATVGTVQPHQRRKGEARDIHRLGSSLMVLHGFLGDRSPAFRAAALNEHLYLPYEEQRGHAPVPQRDMMAAWEQTAATGRMTPPTKLGA